MKHIAIVMDTLDDMMGGVARVAVQLANAFAERPELGITPQICLYYQTKPLPEYLHPSVEVVMWGGRNAVTALPGMFRYLWRQKPRAVLTMGMTANVLTSALAELVELAGRGTRVVVSEHVALFQYTATMPRWKQWLHRLPIAASYRFANRVVAVSNGMAAELARFACLPAWRIHTVYNPLVSESLRQLAEEDGHHPWLQDGSRFVLGVGRLIALKNFPLLLEAFANADMDRNIKLIILGEGLERPHLEDLIRQYGLEERVSLPGFISNPFPFLKAAELLVLPSNFEALPGVLVEAMSMGTPVIATDCISGPREILRDGKDGWLVPVGDVAAMQEAISGFFALPDAAREQLVAAALARAEDFSYGTIAEAYKKLLVD